MPENSRPVKRFALPAFLLIAFPAHADGDVYRGVMDGRIHFLATAKRVDHGVGGSILYHTSGAGGLSLQGTAADDGGFECKEMLWSRAAGTTSNTGLFKGRLAADGRSGEGTWQSPDGRKKHPFALNHIAKMETLAYKDVDATVHFPQLDDPHYAPLNTQLAEDARKRQESQVREVKQWRTELKAAQSEAWNRASAYTSCDIESATPRAVSLLCVHSDYSGGAHGQHTFQSRNFLLAEDGAVQPLGLWDLLEKSPAHVKQLSGLIVADLKRQKASEIAKGRIKDFNAALEKDALPFTVLPNGLAFHFEPYAVGVYAEGSFRAVIPNSKLAGLYRLEKTQGLRPAP